jgi:hypothetical protein
MRGPAHIPGATMLQDAWSSAEVACDLREKASGLMMCADSLEGIIAPLKTCRVGTTTMLCLPPCNEAQSQLASCQ